MKSTTLFATLLLASCLAPLPVVAADDPELARLRGENAALRQRLEVLERSCPAVVTTNAPLAATPPVQSRIAGSSSSIEPVSPVSVPLPASAVGPAVPPGYKLVKDVPVLPYSDTGCTKGGFFSSAGPDALWKHAENWQALTRGMTPGEVEKTIGVEHFDIHSGDRLGWQYGRCGTSAQGTVVFGADGVQYWTAPNF